MVSGKESEGLVSQTLDRAIDTLIKAGKSEEAVELLNQLSREKIESGYDIAINLLNKSLSLNPYNLETVRLLSDTYVKKGSYYNAFLVMSKTFRKFKKESKEIKELQSMMEDFLEKHFHPYFQEAYGDLLMEIGNPVKAYEKYILSGNIYLNLLRYSEAIPPLTKARNIKRTPIVDAQLLKAAIRTPGREGLVKKIIVDNFKNPEIISTFVKEMLSQKKHRELKQIVNSYKNTLLFLILKAIIDMETNKPEDAIENLEKLRSYSPEIAAPYTSFFISKYPESRFLYMLEEKASAELPTSEELFGSLLKTLETEEKPLQVTVDHVVPKDINMEVQSINEGIKYLSIAEAMLGLQNYEEALKYARKSLDFDNTKLKAIVLISIVYSLEKEYNKALSFLFDFLKDKNLSETDRAKIEKAIGNVYEKSGDENKAYYWYVEANKVLKDDDLAGKIKRLKHG